MSVVSSEIKNPEPTCLTIGTFDGVHLGHQFLIKKVLEIAKKENLKSVVLSFDPHPRVFLDPNYRPLILTSNQRKVELMKNLGVDLVEILKFDNELSGLTAREFVENILIKKFGLKHLVIGFDFALGKNRQGDFNYLQNLGKELGFKVTQVEKVVIEGLQPSSGLIRDLILAGKTAEISKILGRKKL